MQTGSPLRAVTFPGIGCPPSITVEAYQGRLACLNAQLAPFDAALKADQQGLASREMLGVLNNPHFHQLHNQRTEWIKSHPAFQPDRSLGDCFAIKSRAAGVKIIYPYSFWKNFVEGRYSEVLSPKPPADPIERRNYYYRLVNDFPEAGTPAFAVLVHLLRGTEKYSSEWRDVDLWQAFIKKLNVRLSEGLNEIFAPVCFQIRDAIMSRFKTVEDLGAVALRHATHVMPYHDECFRTGTHSQAEADLNRLPEAQQRIIRGLWGSQQRNGEKVRFQDFPFTMGTYEGFFIGDYQTPDRVPTPHFAPIGGYGTGAASRLYEAIAVMMTIVEEEFRQDRPPLNAFQAGLVGRMTARRNVVNTVLEGVLSLKDAVTLLTSSRDPKFSEQEMMERVLGRDLATKLAKYAYVGLISPLALSGRFVENVVVGDPPDISERFYTYLRTTRDAALQADLDAMGGTNMDHGRQVFDNDVPFIISPIQLMRMFNIGCPVARKMKGEDEAGLTALSHSLLHLMRLIYTR